MEPQPLDILLQKARAQGQFDSQGDFTVAFRRAQTLVGEDFAQLYPGAYLLKIIQCGVGAGSESINVSCGRKEARVQLVGSRPRKLQGRLLAALRDGKQEFSDHPLGLLSVAVWGALAHGARVEWSCYDGHSGERLLISQDGIELETLSNPPWPCADEGGFFFRAIRDSKLAKMERAFIKDRCGYCPIPLFLDGRLVRHSWLGEKPVKVTDWYKNYHRPGLRILETHLPAPEDTHTRDTIALPPTNDRTCHSLNGEYQGASWLLKNPRVYLLKCPTEGPILGAISVPIDLEGTSRIRLVKFGVCLDAESPRLDPSGLLIVHSAINLQTDLSGMRVIKDDNWSDLVRHLEQFINRTLRDSANAIWNMPGGALPRAMSNAMLGAGGLMTLVATGTSFPPALLGIGVGLLINGVAFGTPVFKEGQAGERGLFEELSTRITTLRRRSG